MFFFFLNLNFIVISASLCRIKTIRPKKINFAIPYFPIAKSKQHKRTHLTHSHTHTHTLRVRYWSSKYIYYVHAVAQPSIWMMILSNNIRQSEWFKICSRLIRKRNVILWLVDWFFYFWFQEKTIQKFAAKHTMQRDNECKKEHTHTQIDVKNLTFTRNNKPTPYNM